MKAKCIVFALLLLPGMLFAGGAQEPEITGPVTVDFWHAMGGARIELIQGIVDEFMAANPDITVNVQYTGSYNDTLNKTKAAAKAGNAPHVFHLYEIGTLGMANSGMVTPMDDLKKWEKIDWNEFFTPVKNYYSISGKHYSMPFNSSTPLLYYNKTFFGKAGLDTEAPPATFADVITVGQKLQGAGLGIKAPITWNLNSWYFEEFHCIMDAPFVNNDNGRKGEFPTEVLFNGEAGQQIAEWWTGMERDGIFLDVGPGWANHRAAFGSGEVAMVMSSTSDVNQLTGLLADKGWEMGTGFVPRPKGAKGGVTIGGGTLWICCLLR